MADHNDPFDRLKAVSQNSAGVTTAKPKVDAGDGVFVFPVPDNAPPPLTRHARFGEVARTRTWTYRDGEGGALFHVCRFDQDDGQKTVVPQCLFEENNKLSWRWKAPPDPRPLYGLDRLAVRPQAVVLITEGEKTCEAAVKLFPDLVPVCWQGGSNATGKSDWSPLQGRSVVILPDADEPGLKAAKSVRGALVKQGVKLASIIALPEGLPKGWDVADEFPASGFTLADLKALIAKALEPDATHTTAIDHQSDDWPAGFSMNSSGLWFQPKDADAKPQWVSGAFDVLGEARDAEGAGWSVVIKFKDRDEREKVEPIPKARLATSSTEVRARLVDLGLSMKRRSPNSGDPFADCLLSIRSPQRITLCPATGWSGGSFVLPNEVISPQNAEPHLFTGAAPALHFGKAGTFEGWQQNIAGPAVGNSRAIFALSVAFAGPLLKLLNIESGGFHLRGSSSSGKSTLAMIAGSVWGGGGAVGFAQSWRATANGLETVATGHSDCLLVLDELGQLAPEEAGGAAYMLSNGMAKARLKSDGTARTRAQWRCLFLSTGEISLSDHIKESVRGGNVMAGQELRVLDLKADAGAGLGAWNTLNGLANSAAAFSDDFKAAARTHYGHAGPAFVKAVIDGGDDFIRSLKETEARFIKWAIKAGDTGQVYRAACRFAVVAAAGEAAIHLRLVPWEPMTAFNATLKLFNEWALGFGRSSLRESTNVLRRIVSTLQREGAAFAASREDYDDSMRSGEARAMMTYGFVGLAKGYKEADEPFYFIHPEGWGRIFKGMDLVESAKVLKRLGYLTTGEGRMQKEIKIRGRKQRLYWVSQAILEHDFQDDLG